MDRTALILPAPAPLERASAPLVVTIRPGEGDRVQVGEDVVTGAAAAAWRRAVLGPQAEDERAA